MLRFLLRQLTRSVSVFIRVIRAYISRKTTGVVTKLRQLGNVSQKASKVATTSVQSIVSAAQSPTKREDYIAIGRLLVSKALIIRVLITLAIVGAVIYFIIWPFVLSRFLTARFFVEDKRVEAWNGRVIVYSDKKKTMPMYAGRLTDGVLNGNGREYDAKGLLSYQGEFQNGIHSGRGISYERGLMVYQGQFDGGTYQGSGILYSKSGSLIYQGEFDKGLYDGVGKLYDGEFLSYEGEFSAGIPEGQGKRYEAKVLLYAGGFHEGLPHGDGVSYYPDGTARYRGGFSAGIFEGNGTEYNQNGAVRYTGAFSEGKYNGNGSLYIADGEHLDAEFKDGAPFGVVRWIRDGHLYYEGEWAADAPSGFGALYDKAGKQIYQGQFFDGTLDGRWLMSLSADDLRAAMGQAELKNIAGGNRGFLIDNAALGLRVLCSYRTEAQDAQVLAAYLSKPADGWTRLLPNVSSVTLGKTDADGVVWAQESVSLSPPPGANLSAGRYDARIADFTGSRAMILFRNGAASAIVWEKSAAGGASGSAGGSASGMSGVSGGAGGADGTGAGASGGADGAGGTGGADGGAAETQMEAFLDAIDNMDTGAGVTSVSVRPEYGTDDPGKALAACASAAEAAELADALLAWWEQAERQAALEENLARADALLSEAQTALSMGSGDEKTVAALQEKRDALSDAVEVCKAEQKKAELRAPAGAEIPSLDASSMSVFFNPGEADVSRVALTAVAYAQTTGKDDAEVETKTKTALVDLQEAYDAAQAALTQYEDAAKNAQDAAQAYSTGAGSKTAWSDALSAQSDAKSAVTSALAAFSRQANALNALTGGWVSRTYGWYEDAFAPLFEAEVLPPVADVPEEASASGGAGADSGASGDTGADSGASGDTGADNGASGGAGADSGASDGTGADSGASGSTSDSGASGDTDADKGASRPLAAPDSEEALYGKSAAQTNPDTDKSLYGGAGLAYKPDDHGETQDPYIRIGEDGKIYPLDPEDEALMLQEEQGQGQEPEEEPDPQETLKQMGEVLVGVFESLFGLSNEED